MTQAEIHSVLSDEVRNSQRLFKARNKAEKAETESMQHKRKVAVSWNYSQQYEKSKEAIRIIVKYLI